METTLRTFLIILVLLLVGCSDSPKNVVETFFEATENQNFEELQGISSPSYKDYNNKLVHNCIQALINQRKADKEFIEDIESALKDELTKYDKLSFSAFFARTSIIDKKIYQEITNNKYTFTTDCKQNVFYSSIVDYEILDVKLKKRNEDHATVIVKAFIDNNKEKFDRRLSFDLIKDVEYGWQINNIVVVD